MLINGKTLQEIKAEYEKAESVGLKCEQEIALVEALMAAEKDAERYRWLRENGEPAVAEFWPAIRLNLETKDDVKWCIMAEMEMPLDEAIDAAIEAGKK